MEQTVMAGGGWGTNYTRMSPAVQARIAAADREYEAEGRRQAQERTAAAEAAQNRAMLASIAAAQDRGEVVDMREAFRNGGVGRTVREAIEYYSAVADVQDMRLAAQARKVQERLNEEWYGEVSADTSAPHPAEVAATEAMIARVTEARKRKREIGKIAAAAVRLDQMKREPRWVRRSPGASHR